MIDDMQIKEALMQADYVSALEAIGFTLIGFDEDSFKHFFINEDKDMLYYSPAEGALELFKFERRIDLDENTNDEARGTFMYNVCNLT